ncbi:MAG: hypothetical protein J3K34DRAFT_164915 [Monoraphidium minutum]|nr:MAG: hypothetical protein J3K34DRAFT_164915 [Monoraphidium minutum]
MASFAKMGRPAQSSLTTGHSCSRCAALFRRGAPARRARCAVPADASGGASAAERVPAPWNLTFDLRERETEWTEANQARLVALTAAQELGLPFPAMEARLDALAGLLPDVGARIAGLRPALVAPLVRDLEQLPGRLIALRELLPGANISALVAGAPQILLKREDELRAAVAGLKALLDLDDRQASWLVGETWLFLELECVEEVMDNLGRLIPGRPPRDLLLDDPSWLLRAQRGQKWLGEHPDSIYWDP